MEKKDNTAGQPGTAMPAMDKQENNPFENNRPASEDVSGAEDELEREQQFKEAQTERD